MVYLSQMQDVRLQMSFSEIKETTEITTVNSRIRASFGQTYLTKDIQYMGTRSCSIPASYSKKIRLSHSFVIFWFHLFITVFFNVSV